MTIRRTLPLLATAVALAFSASARADIVIFTNGRTLKVESYAAVDERMNLTLPSGGKITVALNRIDRVVDDEVVPAVVVEEVREYGEFPQRSWEFDEKSQPLFNSKYDKLIVAAARKHNVDAALVSAVIQAESDFDTREVSNKGARGLMQLMPATAERFGVKKVFDPEQNIDGGVRYLRWLLTTFEGNADLAVAAYNAGEGNVWKYKGIPPFRETINYVKKISRRFKNARQEKQPTGVAAASR